MSLPFNGPVAVSRDIATNDLALLNAQLEGHRSRVRAIHNLFRDYTTDMRKRIAIVKHAIRRLEHMSARTSKQIHALQMRHVELDTLQGKVSTAKKARDHALTIKKREIDALRKALQRRMAVAPKPE